MTHAWADELAWHEHGRLRGYSYLGTIPSSWQHQHKDTIKVKSGHSTMASADTSPGWMGWDLGRTAIVSPSCPLQAPTRDLSGFRPCPWSNSDVSSRERGTERRSNKRGRRLARAANSRPAGTATTFAVEQLAGPAERGGMQCSKVRGLSLLLATVASEDQSSAGARAHREIRERDAAKAKRHRCWTNTRNLIPLLVYCSQVHPSSELIRRSCSPAETHNTMKSVRPGHWRE